MISRWLHFLGTTQALEAGQEDAIRFIATFPAGSAVRTGKLLMRVTETIKSFDDWLKSQKNPDIWLASEKMAEEYLLTIAAPSNRYSLGTQTSLCEKKPSEET